MNDNTSSAKNDRHGAKVIKIIIVVIVIAALVVATKLFDLQQIFRHTLEWISSLGVIAPVIFITIYILACVLLLPGSILTLGSGVVFGVVKGSIVVSIGSFISLKNIFIGSIDIFNLL